VNIGINELTEIEKPAIRKYESFVCACVRACAGIVFFFFLHSDEEDKDLKRAAAEVIKSNKSLASPSAAISHC
jgi:hypothetical protein